MTMVRRQERGTGRRDRRGRRALAVVGVAALTGALAAGWAEAATTITVAYPWDSQSHTGKGFEALLKVWSQRYPDIKVEFQPSTTADKFIAQALGGAPPDIIFVDGPVVSSWAVRGLLTPLGKYVKASNVSPRDFVPPAWRQNEWDGEIWAMTVLVDPNFAAVWNQQLFMEAGLDPERGPATVREWEEYFRKLTRYEGGKLRQIGMAPWEVYGNPNTMYTWGWIFGGQFFDYQNRRATAHDPRNVQALTWLRDYYQRYAPELGALGQGLAPGRNRFTGGREAMRFMVTGELFSNLQAAPDVSIGIGKMPYHEESGNPNPAWVGGWTAGIAVGAKHPDEAWKFLHYLTATAEGTNLFAAASGWFPAYLRSPVFLEKFAKDRYLRVYMDILMSATNVRPAIPVGQVYWDELQQAVASVFSGKTQPAEALQHVSQRVDAELARVLAQSKK